MECDSVHSTIETALKDVPIYLPSQYNEAALKARRIPFPYQSKYLSYSFFKDFSQQKTLIYDSIRPGSRKGDPTVYDIVTETPTAKHDTSTALETLSTNSRMVSTVLLLRFALDRNDVGTSSEEEIWEEESVPSTSSVSTTIASGIHRRSVSSGSDTEEEIERVRARQTANKPVTPSDHKVKESKKTDNSVLNKNLNKTDPFEDDTDVDSGSESQTAKLSLPHLPEFFDNIVFHIACDIDDDERRKLKRYITAYKGYVLDEIDGNVEYTITKLSDTAAECQRPTTRTYIKCARRASVRLQGRV
ncbi:hypothetical protein J6590_023966 [Homalodisca vitripennis]|nr:hypothetical protein J6590_023966 [Homalodisca vitripennis]